MSTATGTATEITATDTRGKLLEAAFWEIYRQGYQAASLDEILKTAGVSKGALYHHFGSKLELGYAVLDEVIAGWIVEQWGGLLAESEDPLGAIQSTIRHRCEHIPSEACALGCPLNNLAQEMSPIDEGFRRRIDRLFRQWRDAIADAIARSKEAGQVRADVDPAKVGAFVVATLEGTIGLAKSAQSMELAESNLGMLADYLDTLRPASALA